MAEADYTPITVQMPNILIDKIIQYGVEHKIQTRKKIYDEKGEQWILTVNLSATVAAIVEGYFKPGEKK